MFSTYKMMEVLDCLDDINEMVKSSDEFKNYIFYKNKLEEDYETKALIDQFNKLKLDFEEV